MDKIIIEFGYSPSKSYKDALNLVSSLSSYNEIGEGKNTLIQFEFDITNDICTELYLLVMNWKNSHILLDGKRKDLTIITNWYWCYQERTNSYNKVVYCFFGRLLDSLYPFGCHGEVMFGCNEYSIGFQNPSKVLSFGRWLDAETWEFNIELMAEFLKQKYFPLRYCPAFNEGYIQEFLVQFPKSININKDTRWEVSHFNGIAPKDKKAAMSIFSEVLSRIQSNIVGDLKIQLKKQVFLDSN